MTELVFVTQNAFIKILFLLILSVFHNWEENLAFMEWYSVSDYVGKIKTTFL